MPLPSKSPVVYIEPLGLYRTFSLEARPLSVLSYFEPQDQESHRQAGSATRGCFVKADLVLIFERPTLYLSVLFQLIFASLRLVLVPVKLGWKYLLLLVLDN